MGHENVTEFILLELFTDENVKVACFVMFLLCYIVILSGNLLILLTIRGSHLSEQPMHFFLSYSTLMGACFTSTVAPTLITDLLVQQKTISYNSCAAQMFYAHFFGATEIFILVAMAYDCYVAICRPLHYMVIMNRQVYYVLVMASAMGAFSHSIMKVLIITGLPFCVPNQIDHYFCDVFPLLNLACMDTRLLVIAIITTTGVFSILTFVALVISYIIILSTLRTRSSRATAKPSPPVVHTSLWSSCSSCPSFSPMPPQLIMSGTTRSLLCFTPLLPPCSTLSSTPSETQTWRMPWGKCEAKINSIQENEHLAVLPFVRSSFIHTIVNTEVSCPVIQSCNPEEWSPPQPLSLCHLTETAYKGSGSDALQVLSSSDILEHSVLCIPWHEDCISALFFRESCEDCMVGFSDLFQEIDNLEWNR